MIIVTEAIKEPCSKTVLILLLFLKLLLVVEESHAGFVGTWEIGTDRPGGDIRQISMSRTDPSACAAICDTDKMCLAFTYVKPGIQGSRAQCYLKETIQPSVASDCCISGIKKSSFDITVKEPKRDRPGRNYKNFPLPEADVDVCRNRCAEASRCKAYTYVKPGLQGAEAWCWLKESVPDAVQNNCCTSGRKISAANKLSKLQQTDLPGGDYRNIYLSTADSSICAAVCGADNRCQAYTYVKPAEQGNKAKCWLKDKLPAPVASDCCTSGVLNGKALPKPKPIAHPFVFSKRTKVNELIGGKWPTDMPPVRWPKSFKNCSGSDELKIRSAWLHAHFFTWRAHQIMQYLDKQSTKRRKQMWVYEYNRDIGVAPNYTNTSPRGWFGPYDDKRFSRIRDAIKKVWLKRFRGKTFIVKCRNNDKNKGPHPCYKENPETGNRPAANHIVYGTINFCNKWLSDSRSTMSRARGLVHEIFHWLKIPNSALWVSDRHDYWRSRSCSKYRAVQPLYREKAWFIAHHKGCLSGNYNRTVINNDNYKFLIYMFGRAVFKGKTNYGHEFLKWPGEEFNW